MSAGPAPPAGCWPSSGDGWFEAGQTRRKTRDCFPAVAVRWLSSLPGLQDWGIGVSSRRSAAVLIHSDAESAKHIFADLRKTDYKIECCSGGARTPARDFARTVESRTRGQRRVTVRAK